MDKVTGLLKRKNILDIKFPCYGITSNHKGIWTETNVTYIKTSSGVYVLDNKNIEGNTLGQRRLRIKNSALYIPRTVIHTFVQTVKSKYKIFIDNTGDIFKYIKTIKVPLKYYKVQNLIELDIGCVVTFKEIDNPILVPCRDSQGINYVGFLVTEFGYLTYDYSEEIKPNTWRKI